GWAGRGPAASPPPALPGPAAREADLPRAEEAKPGRTDLYGDPLPPGAVARVGSLRLWLGGQFNALAYSPDGKAVAACGYDSIIPLWDPSTGRQVRPLRGQKPGSVPPPSPPAHNPPTPSR